MITTPYGNGFWVSEMIDGNLIVRLYIGANEEQAINLFNQNEKGEN